MVVEAVTDVPEMLLVELTPVDDLHLVVLFLVVSACSATSAC